ARMRPHALADDFGAAPRAMLELFLHATRAGLLTLRWNVLCPHCRGAKQSVASLDALSRETVCDTCDIRFDATFDQHVELTFQPSPAVRETWTAEFCVAGPEMTPHVAAQQLLAPGEERVIALSLPPGAYRLRALEAPLSRAVVVEEGGAGAADAPLFPDESWPQGPLRLAPAPAALALRLVNGAAREHLFIIERTAWVEHAVTAAEATSMQTFRDLFSSEAIRPGQEISVGRMAILFTDLRGSTRMYRQIGDAPAFSLVMTHFDVLRRAVAMADGAIVKTIGDAVMGVFQRPLNAITCMLRAQAELAAPAGGAAPLTLKAGIHAGPCIAVTLNDRLDYFGSTVNLAARLEGLSSGGDLIISDAVRRDPEVAAAIDSPGGEIRAEPFGAGLKGFDDERFDLWRVTLREAT
ncbi:MAG: adenylate/guanylate cyclase domain-containing protein, partial [Planctomycetes bacterium]|nr:adenylate/guanylate cyclase domain-containing protein [Planctomycetota bacterium]